MKRFFALCLVLILSMVSCSDYEDIDAGKQKVKHLEFPFEATDVENVEMFYYNVSATPQKKTVSEDVDIKALYDSFTQITLSTKEIEANSDADLYAFRFNLADGETYDIVYAACGVKNGILKSPTGGFSYFTAADVAWNWSYLNPDLEAIEISESELPRYPQGNLQLYENPEKDQNKHICTFADYESDQNATCFDYGTKTGVCYECGKVDTVIDYDNPEHHIFSEYISDNNATCTSDGTLTATCDGGCGKTNTAVDVGSQKPHTFTKFESNFDATCTKDGTKSSKCDFCFDVEIITDEGSAGHSFTDYVYKYESEIKYAKCDNCDEINTLPIDD